MSGHKAYCHKCKATVRTAAFMDSRCPKCKVVLWELGATINNGHALRTKPTAMRHKRKAKNDP